MPAAPPLSETVVAENLGVYYPHDVPVVDVPNTELIEIKLSSLLGEASII